MNRLSVALLSCGMVSGSILAATRHPAAAKAPAPLPILGTRLSVYPDGKGKLIADKGCLQCHSADIPRQQRLTEKQWAANVDKMIRWGADVSPEDKADLVSYLVKNFGPANDGFQPVEVRPVSANAPPAR
jgi:mono/diheme cytochrome c family protein